MKQWRIVPFTLFLFLVFSSTSSFSSQDDLVSKTGFDSFSKSWVKTLQEKGCYSKENPCVVNHPNKPKKYLAQYYEILRVLGEEVKSTNTKESPYIGILKYEVALYESEGNNPEEAKRGNFQCKKYIDTTEIFRFSNGAWVNY